MDLILETIPGVKLINKRPTISSTTRPTETTTAPTPTTPTTATVTTSPLRTMAPVIVRQSQTLSTNDGHTFVLGAMPATPVPYIVTTEEEATEQVDELIEVLKKNLRDKCGFTPNELFRGGSLGLGTTFYGRFDINIIVYSEDIKPEEVEKNGYDKWLGQLHKFLTSEPEFTEKYHYMKTTPHAIQGIYRGVEVDILPSSYWKRPGDLYKFLERVHPHRRFRFSSGATKWQVQFFKQQPNQSQDFRMEFIRRAKAWRDKIWPLMSGGYGRPNDYLISILVLHSYEMAKKRLGVFSTMSPETLAWHTTQEMRSLTTSPKPIDLYWEKYYSLKQYPLLVPPNPPRIIDPANPGNNLYLTGIGSYGPNERVSNSELGDGDWSVLRANIHLLDLNQSVQYWTKN